jgi:hypothetical protein
VAETAGPRRVLFNSCTGIRLACSTLATIICAMRSPGVSACGSLLRLMRITLISPR